MGPYRYTTTKANLSPIIGLEGYTSIMAECRRNKIYIPTVAIGGIDYDDIPDIMNTGVNGIAVSGAITKAPDASAKTRQMIELLQDIIDKRLKK